MFNFAQKQKDSQNIIYVMDRLLDFSIRGTGQGNLDSDLYELLNGPDIYQEIIHTGLIPIVRHNKEVSKEFRSFMKSLSMYIEYDVNFDFYFAKTIHNPTLVNDFQNRIELERKEIIKYLLDKGLISEELFIELLKYKIKNLID